MFATEKDRTELNELIENWTGDDGHMKTVFVRFRDQLDALENAVLSFVGRPGVTYSLRATIKDAPEGGRPMFAMADIIDDDPSDRWLSVCFFDEMITDPDDLGDFVPEGLLGEDAHCFDYDADDSGMEAYITARIDEAHAFMSAG